MSVAAAGSFVDVCGGEFELEYVDDSGRSRQQALTTG